MAKKLVLKITGPDGATQDITRDSADGVVLGSGPEAGVRLADPKVAARHCTLKFDRGSVTVTGHGGETRVRGSSITGPTILKAGDVLELGATRVEVKLGEEARRAAAGVGAYGEAARLFNEELPADAAPTAEARQLEVAMLWGDTIINVRHFVVGLPVTIGGSRENDFQVYSDAVGESFTLVEAAGAQARVQVPSGANVVLRRGGKPADAAVTAQGIEIELHDRVQVAVEKVSFILRWVRPSAMVHQTARQVDYYFTKVLTTAFMAGIVVLAAIFMTDINAESLSEDLFKNPQRFAKLVIKAPEKEKKKIEIKKKLEEKVVQQDQYGKKKDEQKGPNINANKREEDQKKVMRSGLLALLGGGDGATSNVFNQAGLGVGINQALGSLKDSGVSDTGGVGGLGSRGMGPGGGGGLGIGGLGTKGGGKGSLGGYGSINLGGRGKGETRVVPGKTTVTGSCERTVIAKVIGKHANEIRYCYEVELNKDPNLSGKVAVTFTIDPTGGVEDAQIAQSTMNNSSAEGCILGRVRRWKFPEPKGGGVCVINYPWVFKAAGGDDEGGAAE